MAYKPTRKKPIAEINVVPYIDVMLVLLVIFMITAPLLTQGVSVDLPQATAEPLPPQDIQPLIVTVDAQGLFYIDLGESEKPVSGAVIRDHIHKILQQKPNTPLMLRGDRDVAYGAVMDAMVEMQAAGAPSVGLVTETPES